LEEDCKENGKDVNEYKFLNKSNLLYNACLAPLCPHYLKICEMRRHLGVWKSKCPRGFHLTVKANYKLDKEAIFRKFID